MFTKFSAVQIIKRKWRNFSKIVNCNWLICSWNRQEVSNLILLRKHKSCYLILIITCRVASIHSFKEVCFLAMNQMCLTIVRNKSKQKNEQIIQSVPKSFIHTFFYNGNQNDFHSTLKNWKKQEKKWLRTARFAISRSKNCKFYSHQVVHYLMGIGPNTKKIPQNSGKQIRIPEGM